MEIRIDQLIKAIATALDIVEGELLGASTHHGKRIAVLAAAMGIDLGLNKDHLSAMTTCALFHDNALTEHILAEQEGDRPSMYLHCERGQSNVEMLPFKVDVSGYILYHHECADGNGVFGKKEGEYPLEAELIAISDMIDIDHHLQRLSFDTLPNLRSLIADDAGKRFTKRAARALLSILDENMLFLLRDDRIAETAEQVIPTFILDLKVNEIIGIAEIIARIIDYKSRFTRRHTSQIANRAWLMGGYYGYDDALRVQLYLAAALHDLGKLATPTHILEKPGKLDQEEFAIIKEHVRHTYELLKDIDGFEQIRDWASNHHEKLDGTGYPFGKGADALDFNSRMMACIDIYQAVSESRPYHEQRGHPETMVILYDMAQKGFIDGTIVKDLDVVMAPYSNRDIPLLLVPVVPNVLAHSHVSN
ncbi:MAG: HD domain-containing protein [Synergistaceae bacterium]|jgi:HD-GYP domain-containing protein (c-di-GMP phosphodiesterase class II)|nr:HD domain-containing protein [Synergistaceae bacterium]